MTDQSIDALIKGLEALLLFIPAPVRAFMAVSIIVISMWGFMMFARHRWGKKPDAEALLMQDRYERMLGICKRDQERIDQLIELNEKLRERITILEDERAQSRQEISHLKWDMANLKRELETEKRANSMIGGNNATH